MVAAAACEKSLQLLVRIDPLGARPGRLRRASAESWWWMTIP
jgi:hypothetical protein